MSPRIKKLIGTILILLWIPIYAFFAMGVAVLPAAACRRCRGVLFYAIAGTLPGPSPWVCCSPG